MEENSMEISDATSDPIAQLGDLLKKDSDAEENVFQYPTHFSSKTLLELSNCSFSRQKENVQTYVRGCKWSPDGTCCLSVVNNDGMHITELPRDLYADSPNTRRNIDILDSVIHVKESGLVYDFCWYPGMNSQVPESCCWLTTKKNAPIQMWDAFNGSLRCSYRGFNAVDEMEPALSVTFTPDASRIIGGYKKVLRTFDVDRPGRDFSEHKIQSPASCLATNSNLLAIGSWNTTISLYNVSDTGTYKSIGKMHGHGGGVTHIKFTPDGLKLVSGARKDHRLLVWDIRYHRRPLNILTRAVDTNQRVYFDISPCGRYLVTGGTDGVVKVWDDASTDWKNSLDVGDVDGDNVTYKFPLHQDCCNSVSIHPYRPIIATGSGQYHFNDPIKLLDDDNELNLHDSLNIRARNDDDELMNIINVSARNELNNVINVSARNELNNGTNLSAKNELSNGTNLSAKNELNSSTDLGAKDELNTTNISSNTNIGEGNTSGNIKVDMKYSSETENCVVFWWTGELL